MRAFKLQAQQSTQQRHHVQIDACKKGSISQVRILAAVAGSFDLDYSSCKKMG